MTILNAYYLLDLTFDLSWQFTELTLSRKSCKILTFICFDEFIKTELNKTCLALKVLQMFTIS